MTLDPEMELWRKEWSSADKSASAPPPQEILAAAIRHQRRSHFNLGANIAFAILLLTGSFITANRMHSREFVMWAVCVWMTTLIATYLALEGWRKSRMTTMESVADYARFHRKRAIADQWRVRTGAVFLCLQATIACAWLTTDLFRARISLVRFETAIAVLAVVSVLFVCVLVRIWRRSASVLGTNVAEESVVEAVRTEAAE